jgi:hypothetical protein
MRDQVSHLYKRVALEKMVGFVSKGAPAMIGENNGVAAKLKKKLNNSRNRLLSLVSTVVFTNRHCVQKV